MSKLSMQQKIDCKTDLLTFAKTMFKFSSGADFIENWHHKIMCAALERTIIGDVKRLIINLPPRYSKTELAVINYIAWSLGVCPDSEYIHASYSKRLATTNSWKVKSVVESDIYREIFPNTMIREDSKAKDEWRTTTGGIIYATGSEGTITGYGAGKMRDHYGGAIIIDDPHKAGEATSEVRRSNIIDWYTTTMASRTNSPNTPIILIMQRLHEKDLAGWLLDGGSGEKWEHVMIPVLDEKDEPLWEFKHTRKDLERMEEKNPYVFAGQYMQKPSPLGGGIFKESWWKFYSVPPNIEYKIITGDTAQKTSERNDFSVFQLWGFFEGNIYLLDQIRGKWEAPELRMQFKAFWNKHVGSGIQTVGRLRSAYIEDKASGTGLIQDAKTIDKIPVNAVQRNTDKVSRAMDCAPYISSGFVHLPEDVEWLSTYMSEFARFTPLMSHEHDDQIDPTLDAIDLLLRPADRWAGVW